MPDILPDTVLALIHEHQIVETAEPLTADSDLFSHGLDSLAMMQLMMHLERQFQVQISPAEMTRNHFATASVLARWLSHLNRTAA